MGELYPQRKASLISDTVNPDVLRLTAKIVSAHIGNNAVEREALPALIQSVFHTLSTAGAVEAKPATQAPAVPIKKSVFPDYIVCLEDGKKLKMLKRHLSNRFGLSPDQYRQKWGLPDTYPMVAPSYASHRSTLAKSYGLGRKPGAGKAVVAAPSAAEPTVAVMPARRGRPPKR